MSPNTSSINSFIIYASSNYAGDGLGTTPVWQFYDGDKLGTWNASFLTSSGLEVIVGHVYHFRITVDPAALEYSVMVDDLDDALGPVGADGLGSRRSSPLAEPYTVFAAQAGTSGSGGISIDSFKIDVPRPAPPVGLSAMGGDGSVALDWDDNSDPDLAGYNVYRSAGGNFSLLVADLVASSHTDTGVTNGTVYSYVVVAVDTSGNESQGSEEASATPVKSSSSYDNWILGAFAANPGADSSRSGNPDGGPDTNLWEYAFLTDPLTRNDTPFRIWKMW